MSKSGDNAGSQDSALSLVRESWQQFWRQREPRERRMLVAAAAVVTIALVYGVLINPAWSGRAKLQREIPLLRQQVAQMEVLSKQSAQLTSAMAENILPVSREGIEASLVHRSVKIQALAVSDDVVRLQIASMPYSGLMEWLLEVQKTMRITVEEARIAAQPEAGMVSVVLTLKQQRNAS